MRDSPAVLADWLRKQYRCADWLLEMYQAQETRTQREHASIVTVIRKALWLLC